MRSRYSHVYLSAARILSRNRAVARSSPEGSIFAKLFSEIYQLASKVAHTIDQKLQHDPKRVLLDDNILRCHTIKHFMKVGNANNCFSDVERTVSFEILTDV